MKDIGFRDDKRKAILLLNVTEKAMSYTTVSQVCICSETIRER